MTQPTKDRVQTFSGNGKTKSGFDKNLGMLKKQCCIEYPSTGLLEVTDKGLALVGGAVKSMTQKQCHENIKALLSKKAAAVFDSLAEGRAHDKMELARLLGYDMGKLSGYEKDLGRMSSLGFLDRRGKELQLTDFCFPMGRPM